MFEIKEDLTTTNILKKVSEYDIFKYYCKNFQKIDVKFSSELREDNSPSCVISEYGGKLWYKDFGIPDKAIDCFSYVMKKFNMTFLQALGIINLDLNLNLKPYIEHNLDLQYVGLSNKQTINNLKTNCSGYEAQQAKLFTPTQRKWLESDIRYWKNKYYIDVSRAERFGISPISKLQINDGKEFSLEFPSYCYLVDWSKGINYYKIYSPYSKSMKWLSNCKNYHYLGFNYLPWIGEKIIITKSLKDIVVLSLFNLPAIAPQSESQIISEEIYINIKKRFNNIYILFDNGVNDDAGIVGVKKNIEKYPDLIPIFIPDHYGVKDISDFIDLYRYKNTQKLLKTLI